MFLDTPPELLRPIHSLLNAPFDFDAHASLTGPLLEHFRDRGDLNALLELAKLYDGRQLSLEALWLCFGLASSPSSH